MAPKVALSLKKIYHYTLRNAMCLDETCLMFLYSFENLKKKKEKSTNQHTDRNWKNCDQKSSHSNVFSGMLE